MREKVLDGKEQGAMERVLPEQKNEKEDEGKMAEEKVNSEESSGGEIPEKYADDCKYCRKDGVEK